MEFFISLIYYIFYLKQTNKTQNQMKTNEFTKKLLRINYDFYILKSIEYFVV